MELLKGRVITYPRNATFVIDQRKIGRAFRHIASKQSISQALTKLEKTRKPGHITRLSYTEDGRLVPLIREK